LIFDYENKTIQVKIVYYGPAMSGKTTSIKYLFSHFGMERNLTSIDSTVGRTLFFDFGVLQFQGSEWILKFLLYSATGQDFYASTRPATLNGVDGIIFILDAQIEYLEHNIRSWKELMELFAEELYDIPIVFSLNKCDLKNVEKISIDTINRNMEITKLKKVAFSNTIATKGEGVLNAFNKIVQFIFPQLTLNFAFN